jgi:F-type H+-transporting ATPase subunit gamma
MAISPRLIRRRIKSVTGTRKITKAMELVAAAKMRKAVQATLGTRPYAEAAWRAVRELAEVAEPDAHPLLRRPAGAKKTLVIYFSSDRGLCGGFNAQLLRRYAEFAGKHSEEIEIVAVGRKGQDALRRRDARIIAAFSDLANEPTIAGIRSVADIAIQEFRSGRYDAVHIAYTDFRSALVQTPNIKQLLPIVRIEGLGDVDGVSEAPLRQGSGGRPTESVVGEFLFEPSPQAVLDAMLPRLVESQIYQALLESSASEHSARMMAMRSATDAASEMIEDLTLTYNQARQAGITREIAEISSGKAALEK